MLINDFVREKCIYVKINSLFTFYYYLQFHKKPGQKKKGFYHENAKPKNLQNLYSKKKKTQQ